MAEIYNMTTTTSITHAVESCDIKQEVRQILNYGRDGTAYLQITGSPKKYYEVICHATRTQVTLLESAWASGDLLRVNVLNEAGNADRISYGRIIEFDKDYIGYLFDRDSWKDYYKITLKLVYETYTPSSS